MIHEMKLSFQVLLHHYVVQIGYMWYTPEKSLPWFHWNMFLLFDNVFDSFYLFDGGDIFGNVVVVKTPTWNQAAKTEFLLASAMRIHAQVKQIIRSLPILWMLGGGTAGGVGGALRAMATENREKRRTYFMVLNVVLDLWFGIGAADWWISYLWFVTVSTLFCEKEMLLPFLPYKQRTAPEFGSWWMVSQIWRTQMSGLIHQRVLPPNLHNVVRQLRRQWVNENDSSAAPLNNARWRAVPSEHQIKQKWTVCVLWNLWETLHR